MIVFLYSIQHLVMESRGGSSDVRTEYFFVLCRGLQNAVPWLRRLDFVLSPQRSGFDTRSVHVSFVREKWHCDRFFSDCFGFPLSVSFHHLLLHVAVTRKTNKRSLGTFRKAMLNWKSGTIGWKSTFTFCFLKSSEGLFARYCSVKCTICQRHAG